MRTPGNGVPPPKRGSFPRPRISMRVLIRLVLTFAIANAFVAWVIADSRNPYMANSGRYVVWNICLALFLSFPFLSDRMDALFRWLGDDTPRSRRKENVLEDLMALVICSLMFWSGFFLLFPLWDNPKHRGPRDWITPIVILVMGTVALVPWKISRGSSTPSLTAREADPTMVGKSHLDSGETS